MVGTCWDPSMGAGPRMSLVYTRYTTSTRVDVSWWPRPVRSCSEGTAGTCRVVPAGAGPPTLFNRVWDASLAVPLAVIKVTGRGPRYVVRVRPGHPCLSWPSLWDPWACQWWYWQPAQCRGRLAQPRTCSKHNKQMFPNQIYAALPSAKLSKSLSVTVITLDTEQE